MNAMCCSLFFWSLRFLCVAYITHPYYIFPIELFAGITGCLFQISALLHLNEISHPNILTFMTSKFNSLCNLGKLIAFVVGGKLYYAVGARKFFLLSSGACVAWGIVVLCYVIFKRFQQKRIERRITRFEQASVPHNIGDNDYAKAIIYLESLSQGLKCSTIDSQNSSHIHTVQVH